MFGRVVRLSIYFSLFFFSTNFSWAKLKSYREWKSEKVVEIQGKMQSIKMQIELRKKDLNNKKTDSTVEFQVLALEQKFEFEKYNLELANDLSVTDYFVGYLNKVDNKQIAFKELATKMSPDEVAEIMTAYANSVFGGREVPEKSDLSPSASNLKNLNGSP